MFVETSGLACDHIFLIPRSRSPHATTRGQARPDGAVLEDPGMPSSHAMVRHPSTHSHTCCICIPSSWPIICCCTNRLTPPPFPLPKHRTLHDVQALFYMTAFLTKALCEGRGAGLPGWWPLGHTGTIALILLYVAMARCGRRVMSCQCLCVCGREPCIADF